MDAQRTTPPTDRRIGVLALRQHGVVGRCQLVALGVSRRAIDRRLRSGRLHAVHRGVYAPGHAPLTLPGRFMAAVLACGPGAVLSHRSAAVLWGIQRSAPRWVEVTVCGQQGRRRAGIVACRATLEQRERTVCHGIPVTTPGRTLIDLADILSERALQRAVDEADYLRLDCSGFRPLPGRRGRGRVAAVLAFHRAESTRTRTDLEERFLALCRAYDLPLPEVNVHVEGYEVDFLWSDQRLIVETDGRAAHHAAGVRERPDKGRRPDGGRLSTCPDDGPTDAQ